MAALLSVIQLSDDSVEAGYEDGSRLWLAPCGTEFVIERSEDGAHPLRTPERRKQRTEFVTSCCRDKVLQILTFRNTFSSRPFLPLSIVPKEKTVSLLSEISEVVWPDSEDDDHCKTYVACLEDGGVKVSSLDGNAHLYMSALQKEFTVEFLCQLSSKVEVSIHASESHVEGITKDLKNRHLSQQTDSTRDTEREANIANTNTCITTSKYSSCVIREREDSGFYSTKHAFQYTWLAQCFSVACCPEAFLYPMSLALHVQNKMSPDEERLDCLDDELEKNLKRAKSSVLPKALPLSCRGTHLHRWNVCDFRKQPLYLFPLKVAMCNTILYRFFFQGMHFIEIYPGDGSVFISEGRWLGKYFQYYFLNGKIRPKEYRLYTTSNLPPDMPRALYSVRSVIEQAGRFLKMCHNTMLSQSPLFESCCWRDESSSNAQTVFPVLLAKATVPDKGTYTVYSDNTVLAHFLDGVYLHMTWNFNHFNKQEQNKETAEALPVLKRDDFGECVLHFPNGSSLLVQRDCPGEHKSYINTAVSWCRQLDGKAQSETQIPTVTENWSVGAEIQKIQRFQFLLENSSLMARKGSTHLSEEPGPDESCLPEKATEINIQAVLEKTSKAIRDIELLLSSRK